MKLLSVAIPSYNSQEYLHHAVESLLPGGERVEILIVDDGSTDDTARLADGYAEKYPNIVRAIHKENGGHGDAVMTGLKYATGLYFKVVDSDDWVDEAAYPKVLDTLERFVQPDSQLDLLVANYVYDKVGVKHKKVVRYENALPQNRVLTWRDVRRFRIGQYMLMHSAIYRTELLRTCGLDLPKHTFYVDNLYVYVPLMHVERLYYLNESFYHYYIGREDQSVQEQVMIRRIDQQLLVNRLMAKAVCLPDVADKHKRQYMSNYLEIITAVSSTMLVKANTEEALEKRRQLWAFLKQETPENYRLIRLRLISVASRFEGWLGRRFILFCYDCCRRVFGFN